MTIFLFFYDKSQLFGPKMDELAKKEMEGEKVCY